MLISPLNEIHVPQQFKDGRPIERIILISDVDGVIRSCTESDADPRIISSIKALIAEQKIDVVFISGTPIAQDPSLEKWRKGNVTLDKAVASLLTQELHKERLTVFGAMGGQRMTQPGQVEIADEYPLEMIFEAGKLLLYAFLAEVEQDGDSRQRGVAIRLRGRLDHLQLKNKQQQPSVTPDEFKEIVFEILSELDPEFRLISYGAFIETHTSNPPWQTARSFKWLKSQLNSPDWNFSHVPEDRKQVATGLAHRDGRGFNFLMISKTNKGTTIKKYIEEKQKLHPDALIVTIGDTQVDFPMHQHAHLAYHVGQEDVWKSLDLPQCLLVRDRYGKDKQHVEGTLHVLKLLREGFGKSIYTFNQ